MQYEDHPLYTPTPFIKDLQLSLLLIKKMNKYQPAELNFVIDPHSRGL